MRIRSLLPLLLLVLPVPAPAAVTITFWSHELGNDFPHAFFTLRGTPDAGGAAVDTSYGFTAKSITPAILFGKVGSRLDIAKPRYVRGSDAQFALVMTDAQYAAVLALVDAWGGGKVKYDLGTHNCIHFVKEAARLTGLTGLDQPKLMRRPRSYLQAVAAANPGRVTVIRQHGRDYLPGLPPAGRLPAGQVPAGADASPPAGAISTTSSVPPDRG